jgi:hypothetical protein
MVVQFDDGGLPASNFGTTPHKRGIATDDYTSLNGQTPPNGRTSFNGAYQETLSTSPEGPHGQATKVWPPAVCLAS